MPRLIKHASSPGTFAEVLELGRKYRVKRKASRPGAQVAKEILDLTGAVMKHPVTDLIVTGIDSWIDSSKDDVKGFDELMEARKERTKRQAAEARVPKPLTSDVIPKEAVRKFAEGQDPEADYVGMAKTTAEITSGRPEDSWNPGERAEITSQEPARAGVFDKAPRSYAELVAFVSSPNTTPDEVQWAMAQAARFTPVTSLTDIGKPNIKLQKGILDAYEKATKRTPTSLDLKKFALEEDKQRRARQEKQEQLYREGAKFAGKIKDRDQAKELARKKAIDAEKRARIMANRKTSNTQASNDERVSALVDVWKASQNPDLLSSFNKPPEQLSSQEKEALFTFGGPNRDILLNTLKDTTGTSKTKMGPRLNRRLIDIYTRKVKPYAKQSDAGYLPPSDQIIPNLQERFRKAETAYKALLKYTDKQNKAKDAAAAKEVKAAEDKEKRAGEKNRALSQMKATLKENDKSFANYFVTRGDALVWKKNMANDAKSKLGNQVYSSLESLRKAYNR